MIKIISAFIAACKGYTVYPVTLNYEFNDLHQLELLKPGDIIDIQALEDRTLGQYWHVVVDYSVTDHIYEILVDQYVKPPSTDKEPSVGIRTL